MAAVVVRLGCASIYGVDTHQLREAWQRSQQRQRVRASFEARIADGMFEVVTLAEAAAVVPVIRATFAHDHALDADDWVFVSEQCAIAKCNLPDSHLRALQLALPRNSVISPRTNIHIDEHGIGRFVDDSGNAHCQKYNLYTSRDCDSFSAELARRNLVSTIREHALPSQTVALPEFTAEDVQIQTEEMQALLPPIAARPDTRTSVRQRSAKEQQRCKLKRQCTNLLKWLQREIGCKGIPTRPHRMHSIPDAWVAGADDDAAIARYLVIRTKLQSLKHAVVEVQNIGAAIGVPLLASVINTDLVHTATVRPSLSDSDHLKQHNGAASDSRTASATTPASSSQQQQRPTNRCAPLNTLRTSCNQLRKRLVKDVRAHSVPIKLPPCLADPLPRFTNFVDHESNPRTACIDALTTIRAQLKQFQIVVTTYKDLFKKTCSRRRVLEQMAARGLEFEQA